MSPARVVGAAMLAALGVAVGSARADEPAPAVRFEEGGRTFQANCAVCHRSTGVGQPGLAPPLTHNPALYATSAEGRRQLALTVLYGMFGDIVVDERHYNFKMPDFSRFDDAVLAEALNFVVFDLAHAPDGTAPLTPAELARERGAGLEGDAVRKHRAEVLAPTTP